MASNQGGIPTYTGAGAGTTTGSTAGTGASVGAGGVTQGKEGTNLLLTPPTTNPNAVPTLDPSVANKVVTIKGGAGPGITAPALSGAAEQHVKDALGMRDLLQAYQDLYNPNQPMNGHDVQVLKSLGNKKINGFLDALNQVPNATPNSFFRINQGGQSGLFGSVRSTLAGIVEGVPGGQAAGPGSGQPASYGKVDYKGFANPKEVKAALTAEIAKKIPGMNPKALADPANVMNLQLPANLVSEWSDVSGALRSGMTVNDLFTPYRDVAGQTHPAIMSTKAEKAIVNELKTAPQIDTGAQSADQAYQSLVKQFNDPNNQASMISTLENAGLLLPGAADSTPEPTQVYAALANVVTTAATSGQTVQDVIDSGTKGLQTAGVNAASVGPQAAYVSASAANLGVNLTPEQETGIVTKATQGNWDQAQTDMAVASMFQYTPGQQLTGRAANIWSGMQTLQQDYMPGTNLSNATLGNWLTQSIRGIASGQTATNPMDSAGDATGTSAATAAFKQYVQQQAAQMFPTFAQQINEGVTTKTLIDPYAQLAGSLLGYGNVSGSGQSTVNEANDATASLGINWNDPKWQRFLNGGTNPETGQAAPMTLDQARKVIISDPQYGWQNTSMAQNLASHVGDELLQTFGFYKPGGT